MWGFGVDVDAYLVSLPLFAIFFSICYLAFGRKPSNFPPGPFSYPVVGNFFQARKNSPTKFAEWGQKYGGILGLKLGHNLVVVLNNYGDIKEAFNDPAFNGRPMVGVIKLRNDNEHLGVAFSEGPVHTEQRRFVLKNLRDLGFGRKSMEGLVLTEVNEVIQNFSGMIEANGGESVQISTKNVFNAAILNSLWYIATGKRYAHDDPELMRIFKGFSQFLTAPKPQDILMQFFPFVEKLVFKFPSIFPITARQFLTLAKDLLKRVINEEKEIYEEGARRHFIDVYLEQIKGCRDPKSSFFKEQGEKNLAIVMLDLLVAGSETTSSMLMWTFLLLAVHPQAQEKLYRQILDKVGTSRPVSLNDRADLLYLEATAMEALRFASLAPFGVPHKTLTSVKFHGYTIPKNTMVLANLYAVHRDPSIWGEDVQLFRPERFLSPDEKTLLRKEALIPFGSGKRICIGETLARDEIFLFVGNLIQRFDWKTVEDQPTPCLDSLTGQPGIGFRFPQSHELVISHRAENSS